MQRRKVNGFQLAYADIGTGTNVVVLLHGFCGHSGHWRHVIPLISPYYRIIAPDLRGCGQSEACGECYSMDQLADDIYELLSQLDLRDVTLLGHSAGGYITLAFADKHEAMLRAFGLIHSTGLSVHEGQDKAHYLAVFSEIQENSIESYLLGLVKNAGQILDIGLQISPMTAMHIFRGILERPDRCHVIAEAKVPVIVLSGQEDLIIPPQRSLAGYGNHISHVELQGVGHFSMLEDPQQLAKAILNFLHNVHLVYK